MQYTIMSDIRTAPYWAALPKVPPRKKYMRTGNNRNVRAATFWLLALSLLMISTVVISETTIRKMSSAQEVPVY